MKRVEDEVVLDPDGKVDAGDEDKKVSCLLEFHSEPCALQKTNLCNLKLKLSLKLI